MTLEQSARNRVSNRREVLCVCRPNTEKNPTVVGRLGINNLGGSTFNHLVVLVVNQSLECVQYKFAEIIHVRSATVSNPVLLQRRHNWLLEFSVAIVVYEAIVGKIPSKN